ncbi:winged helix-turn-helix domain-containing protein, partial [Cohnella sp. GbtcB17]|uniref:winged helix-turn-helix domain-containing protein n=1 Tax=Cohnella sp. GbtcB17 TaxID=2824762 RepID=UPI0020C6BCC7
MLTHGRLTKVDLSRMLGISFPTVSKFLSDMEREGVLVAAGLDASSGGRRALRYAYYPDHMLGLALFLEKHVTHYSIFI